jgi:hypothetical protein
MTECSVEFSLAKKNGRRIARQDRLVRLRESADAACALFLARRELSRGRWC